MFKKRRSLKISDRNSKRSDLEDFLKNQIEILEIKKHNTKI